MSTQTSACCSNTARYPAPMTDDHDAEMDAIAAELEAASILTVTTEDDGTVTYTLTREGKAIGRQMAMTQGEDARLAMLNELLDASPDT
jgi:hypothetical protein